MENGEKLDEFGERLRATYAQVAAVDGAEEIEVRVKVSADLFALAALLGRVRAGDDLAGLVVDVNAPGDRAAARDWVRSMVRNSLELERAGLSQGWHNWLRKPDTRPGAPVDDLPF